MSIFNCEIVLGLLMMGERRALLFFRRKISPALRGIFSQRSLFPALPAFGLGPVFINELDNRGQDHRGEHKDL